MLFQNSCPAVREPRISLEGRGTRSGERFHAQYTHTHTRASLCFSRRRPTTRSAVLRMSSRGRLASILIYLFLRIRRITRHGADFCRLRYDPMAPVLEHPWK